MNPKILLIAGAMILAIFFAGIVFAGGPGSGGMGGGGHGMMGGGHMMDYGRGYSIPYLDQYNRYNRLNEPNQYGPTEIKRLRQEIREKRQELSKLYESDKPDKELIKKKIDELGKLEAELDRKLSAR
jgi:Spy/CpxP family protein refolding chaperone